MRERSKKINKERQEKTERERQRERDRQRDRETHTERQTDRDRETEREKRESAAAAPYPGHSGKGILDPTPTNTPPRPNVISLPLAAFFLINIVKGRVLSGAILLLSIFLFFFLFVCSSPVFLS